MKGEYRRPVLSTDKTGLAISFFQPPYLTICVRCTRRWIPIETMYVPKRDMIVFVGEYIHLLTKGSISALPHRVAFPQQKTRISFPLLVRGHDERLLDTAAYLPNANAGSQDFVNESNVATSSPSETNSEGPALPPCDVMRCNGVRLRALHVSTLFVAESDFSPDTHFFLQLSLS